MSVSDKLFILYRLAEEKRLETINNTELTIKQKLRRFDNLFKGYCKGVKKILGGTTGDGS